MFEFDHDTETTARGDGKYRAVVSGGWNIGPTPNGGYVLALITNALAQESGDTHPDPLTLSAHYLRPTSPGEDGEIDVAVVRRGRSHTLLQASLLQGSERVRVLATFGNLAAAAGPTTIRGGPPDLPPPGDCAARAQPPSTIMAASTFMHRLDSRLSPATGWIRGEPTGIPEVSGWSRFADGREPDVLSLPLYADAMPPAIFELGGPPGWVPTIDLTVHVRGRPAPGWLRSRFETRFLVGGYLEEDGEIWDSDGKLVAQSRQLAMLLPS